MTTNLETVLSVRDLRISTRSGLELVRGVSFDISGGRFMALVGESGSGKTVIGRSILKLLPEGLAQSGGTIRFGDKPIESFSDREIRLLRGAEIGMVFQEPLVSLNPAMRIGAQMAEGLREHRAMSEQEIRSRSIEMLRRIRIADPETCLDAYPHQFSGGMRQRIMLASVMLLKPKLLIADEPTTALDSISQREVLETMTELTRETGTAVLLITHDLGVVSRYAKDVVVLKSGEVVEAGQVAPVLNRPEDPYTKRLLASVPRLVDHKRSDSRQPVILEGADLRLSYGGTHGRKAALDGVSLKVHAGETVAVVGASGSGKTTLGRALLRLVDVDSGNIFHHGAEITNLSDRKLTAFRRRCQIVFQDPFSSLDPRMRVGAIVREALRGEPDLTSPEAERRMKETLEEVGLASSFADRLPHQLSGGQRQRVAIARAIVRRPELIVADEPISALDMTVQRQILDLFGDLQRRFGFSCIFISHDLAAVQQVANRIVVMEAGRIVEEGDSATIFARPQHEFTKRLIAASPILEARCTQANENQKMGVTQ